MSFLSSFSRLTLVVFIAPILVFGSASGEAKTRNTRNLNIIDIDMAQIISGYALKKETPDKSSPYKYAIENFRTAKPVLRLEAPFHLNVDRHRGEAYVDYPFILAPGTNDFTPKLSLRIGTAKGTHHGGVSDRLIGVEGIRECEDSRGLCLGATELVKLKEISEEQTYTLKTNPRVHIAKKSMGFVLSDGNGLKQFYEPAAANVWRLKGSVDQFENFALYNYAEQNGTLLAVHYGQDGGLGKNLRSVHFRYNKHNDRLLEQVESKVGQRVVRVYQIARNIQGQATHLYECAPEFKDSSKLTCFAPSRFEWMAGNDEAVNSLSSLQNGIGGRTDIHYENIHNIRAVKALVLYEGSSKMAETHFAYSEPQFVNSSFKGFVKTWSQTVGQPLGDLKQYGKGNWSGILVYKAMFRNDIEDALDPSDYDLVTATEYVYGGKDENSALPLFLNREILSVYGENSELETRLETSYRYDQRNRIKRIIKGKIKEVFTYLDEQRSEFSNSDLGNLVVDKSRYDRVSGKRSQRLWQYEIQDGRLVGSHTSILKNGGPPTNEITQLLDRHGNVSELISGAKNTRITYDPLYNSFPIKTEVSANGETVFISMEFDAATGQIVTEKFQDGSKIATSLNEVGQIQKVTTLIKGPISSGDKGSSPDVTTIETIEISELGGGHVRETKRIEKSKSFNEAAGTITIASDRDALGRVVKVTGTAQDLQGTVLRSSSLENQYSLAGQVIIFIDDTGRVQKRSFDPLGRLIHEEETGYGVTEFRYDENNRLSEIIKNGQIVMHDYDDHGRLASKLLPDGREFKYQYDDKFKDAISRVILPSNKVIEYKYADTGHVSEKRVLIPDGKGGKLEFATSFLYENDQLSSVEYPDGSEVFYQYDGSRLTGIHWGNKPSNWSDKVKKTIADYKPEILKNGSSVLTKMLGNGVRETYRWHKAGQLQSIGIDRIADDPDKIRHITDLAYTFSDDSHLITKEMRTDFLREKAQNTSRVNIYDQMHMLAESSDFIGGKVEAETNLSSFNMGLNSVDKDIQLQKNRAQLSFDQNANITGIKTAQREISLDFDVENRLLTSQIRSGRNLRNFSYEYDHQGQRIEKREIDGAVTYFINPFYEFTLHPDGKMQETLYVWDHMGRIAAFTNEVTDADFAALTNGSQWANLPAQKAGFAAPLLTHSLLPVAVLMLVATFLLFAFESLTGSKNAPVVRNSIAMFGKTKRLALTVVIFTFASAVMAPSVQAALEGGDGVPKIDHVTYFHHDIRGSVIAVSDEQGHQSASVGYTPYGVVSGDTLTAGNNNFRFKFTGMEFDEETGLYYDAARYYSPELGRFLSPDPARSTQNPYAYTNGDPVNYIDPDGRMIAGLPMAFVARSAPQMGHPPARALDAAPDNATRTTEVRYPTFWNWTFKNVDVDEGPDATAPARNAPNVPATQQDTQAYDQLLGAGYMQGWSRLGGYLLSLMGVPLLAWLTPSSYTTEAGETLSAGFGTDFGVYFLTVNAFSAFGKGYSANEAQYWSGIQARGATSNDYKWLGIRRMIWKVGVQVLAFTGIRLLSGWASGYPVFGEGDVTTGAVLSTLGLHFARYAAYSFGGNISLIPYFLMVKEPLVGYDDTMSAELLNTMPWWKRWTLKASMKYRRYSKRKGFWAEDSEPGSWKRFKQNLWYPSYVLQMYGLYLIGSLGYYGGLAAIKRAIPTLTWDAYFSAWRRNLLLIVLSPTASPFAMLNFKRKSFTLMKKRALSNPRTSGFWFRVLGPIEGLRIARYDDRAYLSEEEWLKKLQDARSSNDRAADDLEMEDRGSITDDEVPRISVTD